MSTRVLVAYATRYGSTKEVADAVTASLAEAGLAVETHPVQDVRTLESYAAIVLGAPLYMYRWHKGARRFLSLFRDALRKLRVAVFALGPTHEPPDEQEWADSRAQLDKELAKFPWLEPVSVELFGGKYDPEKLPFPINLLAGQEPASDIRNWNTIDAWASNLATKLEPGVA